MAGFRDGLGPYDILHEISNSLASVDPMHVVLSRIVSFVCAMVPCDLCFLYTLEENKLVLRASRTPPRAGGREPAHRGRGNSSEAPQSAAA